MLILKRSFMFAFLLVWWYVYGMFYRLVDFYLYYIFKQWLRCKHICDAALSAYTMIRCLCDCLPACRIINFGQLYFSNIQEMHLWSKGWRQLKRQNICIWLLAATRRSLHLEWPEGRNSLLLNLAPLIREQHLWLINVFSASLLSYISYMWWKTWLSRYFVTID